MLGDSLSLGGSDIVQGWKTSLTFLSGLLPALTGDNMLLRELAAVNSTPYLNSPHSRGHPSSGPSQRANSPTRSLTPPPQHTGCQRRETEEIRSGWELYVWCPLPSGAGRGQPHLLCPVRWLRYWTRPLASPLLSSSVLSNMFSRLPRSQPMRHLSLGGHHFTQVLPWGQVLEQMAQTELPMHAVLQCLG